MSPPVVVLGATSELGRAACLRLARDAREIHAGGGPSAARLLGADVTVHASIPDALVRRCVALDCEGPGPALPALRTVRSSGSLPATARRGERVLRHGWVLDPELRVRGPGARSWITRDDLVERCVRALDEPDEGVTDVGSSEQVTAREIADAVAQRERRGTPLQRALADLLAPACTIGPVTAVPQSAYLARRRPLRELSASVELARPVADVLPFFTRPGNLAALTPSDLGFRIVRLPETGIADGAIVDYVIRLGLLPMPWRTRIEAWDPPRGFVDSQLFGPYRCWWHEHRFEETNRGTLASDRVLFSPLGGRLAEPLVRRFVERTLARIFSFRARAMRLRFG